MSHILLSWLLFADWRVDQNLPVDLTVGYLSVEVNYGLSKGMHKWGITVLLSLIHSATSQCLDGVHNVITVDSYGSAKLPVRVRNITILVYDIHYRPSCHNGQVNVLLPGYFHIISGEVEVPKDYDLFSNNLVRATVRLGNTKICEEGDSGMIIVPNKLCHFDVKTVIPPEICRVLQKKGTHTLAELQEKLNFNSTLELPPSPSFLGITLLDLLKGEYYIKISLEVEHEKIMEFAMPSGFKALKMGLQDDDD
ncbi:hypothetical protein Y032_0117g699 [Ancylostoma ceylanicum]|uniref:Uncharacterized protein n=1 Tax=Ancylostoma ceylanicum TaxID=53326 RepID=A0A016TC39_9BILA|nr:hypothetical protein Y032_0117g699 [Ancylostoma ceylanicum]